jgi:hypothetical protein
MTRNCRVLGETFFGATGISNIEINRYSGNNRLRFSKKNPNCLKIILLWFRI